jgi:DNA-binding NtrC family response regulator
MRNPVVLIVDDEPLIFDSLRRELKREPYRLVYAHNGADALRVLETEPVDIMVCDHMMPGMTGVELLKSVSTRYPDVVRVLLTGHASMRLAREAINQGSIYKFLTKPCEPEEMRLVLREAVRLRVSSTS